MNDYQLKKLNDLWDKKIKGWTLTKKDKKELKHLNDLWEREQGEKSCNSWKANQPI